MKRYWTSDIHFGHLNIIKYCDRPFGDPEDMNAQIIERWNEVVQPDDAVMVLGDVALGKIRETLPLVGKLNGTKYLVPGNHDRCWPGHKGFTTWNDKYLEAGFARILPVQEVAHIGPKRTEVLICHFPYHGDSHEDDRYTEWRPKDFGMPLLHGHVHDTWLHNANQFNVGLDVHDYRPVAEDEIAEWLETL